MKKIFVTVSEQPGCGGSFLLIIFILLLGAYLSPFILIPLFFIWVFKSLNKENPSVGEKIGQGILLAIIAFAMYSCFVPKKPASPTYSSHHPIIPDAPPSISASDPQKTDSQNINEQNKEIKEETKTIIKISKNNKNYLIDEIIYNKNRDLIDLLINAESKGILTYSKVKLYLDNIEEMTDESKKNLKELIALKIKMKETDSKKTEYKIPEGFEELF